MNAVPHSYDRRSHDSRLDSLEARATIIEQKIDRNTEITQQIADLLSTFKVMASVAKWIAAIAAAVSSVIAAIKLGR